MNKNEKSISIKTLKALCHIIDEYLIIRKDLDRFYQDKTRASYHNLFKMLNGKHVFCRSWERKFYKNNKDILKKIQNYSPILEFIGDKQDRDYFYNYLIVHQEDLDIIKKVVNKIEKLGINYIYLNENADFTQTTNCVYKNFVNNNAIHFYDNMLPVINYSSSLIKYKTASSNYDIVFNPYPILKNDKVIFPNIGVQKIILNSLVFDSKKLPKKLDKENTFDQILALEKQIEKEKTLLREVVDAEVYLAILERETACIEQSLATNELGNEYQNHLNKIKLQIDAIRMLNSKYADYMNQQSIVSLEDLEQEKTRQLKIKQS